MIRLVQRRLIIPRGDTGTFSVPLIKQTDQQVTAVFTIFDERTQRKVYTQAVTPADGKLTVVFEHSDTVNLKPGKYVWDIKFYINPETTAEGIINGDEIDSYYAAYSLPVCEIRQTGDDLMTMDGSPETTLDPDSINMIQTAINEIQHASEIAEQSAASATASKNEAQRILNEFTELNVAATELEPGSTPTVSYDNTTGTISFGLARGNDGYTVLLSNAGYVFPGSRTAAIIGGSTTTTVSVLHGATPCTVTIDQLAMPAGITATIGQNATVTIAVTGTYTGNAAVSFRITADSLQHRISFPCQVALAPAAPITWVSSAAPLTEGNTRFVVADLTGPVNETPLIGDFILYKNPFTNHLYRYTATHNTNTGTVRVGTALDLTGQDYVLTNADKQEIAGIVETIVPAEKFVPTTGTAGQVLIKTNSASEWQNIGATALESQAATISSKAITPAIQDIATFYGLAAASGDTTQTTSRNEVGNYTENAKAKIQCMIGIDKIVGSDETDEVANRSYVAGEYFTYGGALYKTTTSIGKDQAIVPNWNCVPVTLAIEMAKFLEPTDYATTTKSGAIIVGSGLTMDSNHKLKIQSASDGQVKAASATTYFITPSKESGVVFYGLAKAAGDNTQSDSSNQIGSYTSGALTAIQDMLDVAAKGDIPTNISDLSNDLEFITSADVPTALSGFNNDLGFISSTEIIDMITSAINGITGFSMEIVNALPASGDAGVIYLLPGTSNTNDIYEEYIYVNNGWEKLGNFDASSIDLSNYLQTSDIADWAKAATKPTYTASEVGALSSATIIPSNVSDLVNDSGFITSADLPDELSDLVNDLGFITSAELNAMDFITSGWIATEQETTAIINDYVPKEGSE